MKKSLLILLGALSASIYSQDLFNLNLDNDGGYSDKYYSNGMEIELEFRDENIYNENRKAVDSREAGSKQYVKRYNFGQKLYTPSNIKWTTDEVDKYERPYCGLLYIGFAQEIYDSDGSYITHDYKIGITGKGSFGEMYQSEYHDLIGSPQPMGWDLQIDEGVYFQYTLGYYPQNIILYKKKDKRMDFRYGSDLDLGNLYIKGNVNIKARYGRILGDFESGKARFGKKPEKKLLNMEEYYLYGRSILKGIAYDMTYEGGLINNDSPYTVEIYPIALEQNFGFVLAWERFTLEYKFTLLSSESKKEDWMVDSHMYNTLNFRFGY